MKSAQFSFYLKLSKKLRSAILINQVFLIDISAKIPVENLPKIFLSTNELQFTKKYPSGIDDK